jgi:hypothetical protein
MMAAYELADVRAITAGQISEFGTRQDGDQGELSGCAIAPIPRDVIAAMLRLAKVSVSDILYDLSFDNGDIVIAAARNLKTRGVDFETDIRAVQEKARQAGVADLVRVPDQSLWDSNIGEATVVTVNHAVNSNLRQKLLAELKPGSRIVSWAYRIGDLPPDDVVDVRGHKVLLWTVPSR